MPICGGEWTRSITWIEEYVALLRAQLLAATAGPWQAFHRPTLLEAQNTLFGLSAIPMHIRGKPSPAKLPSRF